MNIVSSSRVHTFHIPVMGTGFSVDAPLRVARYGISSVISLVDDVLIEQIRKFHCDREGEPYTAIPDNDEDCRAHRVTAYLNLVDRLVRRQFDILVQEPFEEGNEIHRYFELLPENRLKQDYRDMLTTVDEQEKIRKQNRLRKMMVPGEIDANIMTKLDRDHYRNGEKLPPEFSDAMAALRGFAKSTLRSSIILSAGFSPRLYSYAGQFDDFFPDENGVLRKKITLKVSDYRSAEVQGKYLAKRGLWVSEYRIESGLNCGGHAFATKGYLLGPILEEFKQHRDELVDMLFRMYVKALDDLGRPRIQEPYPILITVQGGIGTASENELLLRYYNVGGTGWGTPFLLVPEVINVDDTHLQKLVEASDHDVSLSNSSPMGVPFWSLRTARSEEVRCRLVDEGNPGSSCPKGFLVTDTEFTKTPVCKASRGFLKKKLKQLEQEGLPENKLTRIKEVLLSKLCLCRDLAGNATLKDGIEPDATPAICCDPNVVNFSKVSTLDEMVDHIYGRSSVLTNPDRHHMFINELMLYVDYLQQTLREVSDELVNVPQKYFSEFKSNLLSGIEYYRRFAENYIEDKKDCFLRDLKVLREQIESISFESVLEKCRAGGG